MFDDRIHLRVAEFRELALDMAQLSLRGVHRVVRRVRALVFEREAREFQACHSLPTTLRCQKVLEQQ